MGVRRVRFAGRHEDDTLAFPPLEGDETGNRTKPTARKGKKRGTTSLSACHRDRFNEKNVPEGAAQESTPRKIPFLPLSLSLSSISTRGLYLVDRPRSRSLSLSSSSSSFLSIVSPRATLRPARPRRSSSSSLPPPPRHGIPVIGIACAPRAHFQRVSIH